MEEFLENIEQISEEEPIIEPQRTYSLLGIEMPLEEFDRLICEQNKGKELVVENGKVVARERIITQEELNEQRKLEIQSRLNELSQDFVQAQCGAVFDDLEQRKTEFQTLHNELRVLLGKEPREYK